MNAASIRRAAVLFLAVGCVLARDSYAGDHSVRFFANWDGNPAGYTAYGTSLAGLGDVNGDGFDDIAVGAPSTSNGQGGEGRVYVHHGAQTWLPTTPSWTYEPNVAGAAAGQLVAGAGDVNGDGFDDLLVGLPGVNVGLPGKGLVHVFHGGLGGLAAAPSWTFQGDLGFIGHVAAGVGDLNGDGYDDVALLRRGSTTSWVLVFHGSATGLGAAPAAVLSGNEADQYGQAVSGAGDVDGDGFDDLVVGAWGADGAFTDEGAAYVHLGSAAGVATLPSWSATGTAAQAWFGFAVAGAGDVDGDGFDDLLVGAPGSLNSRGRISLFGGSAQGLTLAPTWSVEGEIHAFSRLGHAVAGLGDVNDDGYTDLVAGAPGFGGTNIGRVFVYVGGPAGPATIPNTALTNGAVQAQNGRVVDGAGDVNGDGFDDAMYGSTIADNGVEIARVHHGGPFAGAAPYGEHEDFFIADTLAPPRLGMNATVFLKGGASDAQALAFVGIQPAELPFDGGTFWLVPTLIVPLGKMSFSGFLQLDIPVPSDPTLSGLHVYLQFGNTHASLPGFYQLGLSNGLHWTIGS